MISRPALCLGARQGAFASRAGRRHRGRDASTARILDELIVLGCIEARPGPDGTIGYHTTPLGNAALESP